MRPRLEWEKTYLLAADYGESWGTPWDKVIDFDKSRLGFLGDCQATTLCCFLDACREVNIDQLKNLSFGGQSLWDTSAPPSGDRDARVFKATRFGEKAHGPPGKESYFMQALIRCFESLGAGGPPHGAIWSVDTESLGRAMRQLMRRTLIPDVGPGACDIGGASNTPEPTMLHELPGVACALGEIAYSPETALQHAQLSYRLAGSKDSLTIRTPACADSWKIEVPAGSYDVAAQFQNGQYPARSVPGQIIWPPFTPCRL